MEWPQKWLFSCHMNPIIFQLYSQRVSRELSDTKTHPMHISKNWSQEVTTNRMKPLSACRERTRERPRQVREEKNQKLSFYFLIYAKEQPFSGRTATTFLANQFKCQNQIHNQALPSRWKTLLNIFNKEFTFSFFPAGGVAPLHSLLYRLRL